MANQAGLDALRLCGLSLRSAEADAMKAVDNLTGARLTRAEDLCEKIRDVVAYADRLSFVVCADLRYEQHHQQHAKVAQ